MDDMVEKAIKHTKDVLRNKGFSEVTKKEYHRLKRKFDHNCFVINGYWAYFIKKPSVQVPKELNPVSKETLESKEKEENKKGWGRSYGY